MNDMIAKQEGEKIKRENDSKIEWTRLNAKEVTTYDIDDIKNLRLKQLTEKVADLCDLQPTPASMVRPPRKEMLKELRGRAAEGRCPTGVMHCWGGTPQEMDAFLELGFYISFSGTVTFPKATDTHDCARQVPEDRFLVETDCPFLAPVPRRGKRNEPSYVAAVAARVAELRNQSLESVASTSTANARRLFALP